MFDRLSTLPHRLRVFVEALLYGFQHILVLPARDAPLHAGGAAFRRQNGVACEQAFFLLPADLMQMWPISMRVNKPENDDPSIIEPIELATVAAQKLSAFAIKPGLIAKNLSCEKHQKRVLRNVIRELSGSPNALLRCGSSRSSHSRFIVSR